jgi:hypothetical protein
MIDGRQTSGIGARSPCRIGSSYERVHLVGGDHSALSYEAAYRAVTEGADKIASVSFVMRAAREDARSQVGRPRSPMRLLTITATTAAFYSARIGQRVVQLSVLTNQDWVGLAVPLGGDAESLRPAGRGDGPTHAPQRQPGPLCARPTGGGRSHRDGDGQQPLYRSLVSRSVTLSGGAVRVCRLRRLRVDGRPARNRAAGPVHEGGETLKPQQRRYVTRGSRQWSRTRL